MLFVLLTLTVNAIKSSSRDANLRQNGDFLVIRLEPVLQLHHHRNRSGRGDILQSIGRIGHSLGELDFIKFLAQTHVLHVFVVDNAGAVEVHLSFGRRFLYIVVFRRFEILLGSLRHVQVAGSFPCKWRELHGGLQAGVGVNEVALVQFFESQLLLVVLVEFAEV